MNIENYQKMLSALTDIISPFDSIDDKTKTKLDIDIRTINLPSVFKNIVVEGDANSKTISFSMQRTFDSIDMSDKTIIIKYINAKNQGDWYKVEDIIIDEEYIQFTWLLNEHVASAEGVVNYIIEFSGNRDDLPFYWHTNPSFLKVEKGLDVDGHIISAFPSILENHDSRLIRIEQHLGLIPDPVIIQLAGVHVGSTEPDNKDTLWLRPR